MIYSAKVQNSRKVNLYSKSNEFTKSDLFCRNEFIKSELSGGNSELIRSCLFSRSFKFTENNLSKSEHKKGITSKQIIGISCGLAAVIIIVLLVVFIYYRKQKNKFINEKVYSSPSNIISNPKEEMKENDYHQNSNDENADLDFWL